MTMNESIGFGIFIVSTIGFFLWVLYLMLSK